MSASDPKRTWALRLVGLQAEAERAARPASLKLGVVPFGDGLCIKGTSVVENVCDFGLAFDHGRRRTAAEQHRYEPGLPQRRND